MKKISVIGTGYVGLVSGTCFAETGNIVTCCDMDDLKIHLLNCGEVPIYEPGLEDLVKSNMEKGQLYFTTDIPAAIADAEVIYIAVGTPMGQNGKADLSYIESVAKTIGEHINGYKVIVNKSTVPVGTGALVKALIEKYSRSKFNFDVVSNPEFLREGTAVQDTLHMERAVIGASNENAASIIEELHQPFKTTVIKTNIETAEMIKYASNAFLATKISFINDIANICERVGADVTQVAEGIGLDSRIGNKFLQAGIGYGGSCFPKDTLALIQIAEEVEYNFKLLKSVVETNKLQKERLIEKVLDIFGSLEGKRIAVLGLTFKPSTNDLREAPSLTIIPALQKLGAIISAYDPVAIEEAKKELGNEIMYFDNLNDAVKEADACIILTDWFEVKNMNLGIVRNLMKSPYIIDGRNCLDISKVKEHGFNYISFGRPAILEMRVKV